MIKSGAVVLGSALAVLLLLTFYFVIAVLVEFITKTAKPEANSERVSDRTKDMQKSANELETEIGLHNGMKLPKSEIHRKLP